MTDTTRVTRRRLLGGLVTVGAASAAAGAGTMAVFTDSEQSGGNDLSAGTLDLTLDGQDATVQFLSAATVAPGDSGSGTVTLRNTGSVPGYVDIVVATTNFENGLAGNEKSADNTGGDPGQGNGELQNSLETTGTLGGTTVWSNTTVVNLQSGYDEDVQLSPGTSADFVLGWQLPSSTGREAQTDSVEVSLTFRLDQRPDTGV